MIEMDDINRKLDETFKEFKKYPLLETTLSLNQFGVITLSLSKRFQSKRASLEVYSWKALHFPNEENSLSSHFKKDFSDHEWEFESIFLLLLKKRVQKAVKTFLQEFEAIKQEMESLGLTCTGYSSYRLKGIVFELDPLYDRTFIYTGEQIDEVEEYEVNGTDLKKALVKYGKSSADRFMSLPEKARDYILGNP